MLVRRRIRGAFLGALGAGLTLVACAGTAGGPPAREVVPAEIVTVAPAPPKDEEPRPAPIAKKPITAEPVVPDESMFPAAWRSPRPTTSFADEVTIARALRTQVRSMSRASRYARLNGDAGIDNASLAWLSKLLELRERADRAYASAWIAQDATPEGKVEVLSEATTLAQELRATLESAGYQEIPAAWKADPMLHATFEDIAHGPVRRLGEESRALAFFCVASADRDHVRGRAADSCRRAAGPTPAAPEKASGEDKGCACAKGDPLCTTSDWCK